MPLDGHSYLVAQGWGGKGTGLRQGAISRPLAIPQKKTLAGLGKDRDEAFPFWDHLFTAAAKSIQVKCLSDDEDGSDDPQSSTTPSLKRTSTGILSNRRPTSGTPATSGSSTPTPGVQPTRPSLLVTAKRDAAKRGLYSRFFRGPILAPDAVIEEDRCPVALVSEVVSSNTDVKAEGITMKSRISAEVMTVDLEVVESRGSKKRRKCKDEDQETEEMRRERKRRRKEEKERSKGKEKKKKDIEKEKAQSKDLEVTPEDETPSMEQQEKQSKAKSSSKAGNDEPPIPLHSNHDLHKTERRRRKEEKKRLKALKEPIGETKQVGQGVNSDLSPSHSQRRKQAICDEQEVKVEKANKKKRKREHSDEGEG